MDTPATHKFIIALNKTLEPGVAMNAAAHMALALMQSSTAEQKEQMQFLNFIDANGGVHKNISGLSLIIMRGSNGDLRKFRRAALDNSLLCVDFTETMTKDSYKEQLERTKATKEEQMTYFGVAVFAEKAALDPLTKKLSVWRTINASPPTEL